MQFKCKSNIDAKEIFGHVMPSLISIAPPDFVPDPMGFLV